MSPAVSIITPTFNRHALAQGAAADRPAQSGQDFEWLILDDGPEPCAPISTGLSDPRIRYHHLAGAPMLVSAKRNWLCERAHAPVIAQFDDDDYYAPHYLATMLARLHKTDADITKLSAWFVYSAQLKRLGYWDTANTLGLHFTFGPEPVLNAFFNQTPPDNMKNNYAGYGFSYVFKKSMWEKAPFPHVKYASDYRLRLGRAGQRLPAGPFRRHAKACACMSCARTICPKAFRSICCRISCWQSCSRRICRR